MIATTLQTPLAADRRGTLATLNNPWAIVEQSLRAIVSTRQGERVMLPDYGIPDFAFSVLDAGFAARVAYFVEQQILRYEPLVATVRVTGGAVVDGTHFTPDLLADAHRAAISINYTVHGDNAPRNLVFPLWQLGE